MTRPSKWSVSHVKTHLHEPLLTSCFMAAEPSQCSPEASKHIHISISCNSLRCPVFVTEPKRANNSLCTQSYPRCSLCNMKISFNHLIWSRRRPMHVVPRVHCTTEIKVGFITEPHRSKKVFLLSHLSLEPGTHGSSLQSIFRGQSLVNGNVVWFHF